MLRRFWLPGLVLLLSFWLAGCEKIVLDPNDPYENSGNFGTSTSATSFDTATSSENLSGLFYYPSKNRVAGAHPLVVLTHGFGATFYDYQEYARHLASHGYIVLGFNYVDTSSDATISRHDHKAIQLKEAITHALQAPAVAAWINPDEIAVMGHSMGGKISFLTAAQDSRIKTIIALDPSNAGGPPCNISPANCANYPAAPNPGRGHVGVLYQISSASSLIIRSNPDATNPAAEFNAYYFFYGDDAAGHNGAPAPAYYINMGSAAHASYLPAFSTPTPAIVKRSSVAWLKMQFDGVDTSTYFTGSKMQADITAKRVVGVVTRL